MMNTNKSSNCLNACVGGTENQTNNSTADNNNLEIESAPRELPHPQVSNVPRESSPTENEQDESEMGRDTDNIEQRSEGSNVDNDTNQSSPAPYVELSATTDSSNTSSMHDTRDRRILSPQRPSVIADNNQSDRLLESIASPLLREGTAARRAALRRAARQRESTRRYITALQGNRRAENLSNIWDRNIFLIDSRRRAAMQRESMRRYVTAPTGTRRAENSSNICGSNRTNRSRIPRWDIPENDIDSIYDRALLDLIFVEPTTETNRLREANLLGNPDDTPRHVSRQQIARIQNELIRSREGNNLIENIQVLRDSMWEILFLLQRGLDMNTNSGFFR